MATIDLQVPGQYEVLESGYYTATLEKVTLEEHEPDMYHEQPYKQLRWAWILAVPGREDEPPYTSWTSLSLHEKSKLPGLLRALGTAEATSLDPEALVGLSCRINIEEQVRPDGSTKNRTAGYAPLKSAAAKPKPRPQPADDEDVPF